MPAVRTGSIYDCFAGWWFKRLGLFKGHFLTTGCAFDCFDTGGNSGCVYLVAFLTVRTGDFHFSERFNGSGFGAQGSPDIGLPTLVFSTVLNFCHPLTPLPGSPSAPSGWLNFLFLNRWLEIIISYYCKRFKFKYKKMLSY